MPQSQNQHATVASTHGFGDLPSIDEQRFDNDCLPTPPIIASALNAETPSGQNALPVPNHYDSDSVSINGGHTPFFGLSTPFLSTTSSPTLSKFINSATPSSSSSSSISSFSTSDASFESKNNSQAYNSAFSTYTTSPASVVMQQYMSSADPFLSKINAKPYEENKSTLSVVASSGSVSPSKQHPLPNLSFPSSAFSKFNSPPIPYQGTYPTVHQGSNIMSLQNHMYIPPQNYPSNNILPPASSIQPHHGNPMSFPANYGPHYDVTAMSKKRKNGQISIHSETEEKNESDKDVSNPPASPGVKRARTSPVSSPEDFSTSGIPAASLVLPSQRNMYIKLTSGMVNASKDKQPGGKGNKRPLDPHQVEVDVPKLAQHNHEFVDLKIEASLIGSKDSMEVELETLGKIVVSEKLKGKHHANKPCNFIFDNLIVQHSSHSNGRKLYVRFKLLEKDTEAILGFCDSAPFETITKRGIEKQKKKSKQTGISNEQTEIIPSATDSVPSTASAPSASSIPPPILPPTTSFEFRLPPSASSNSTISPPFSSPLTPSHASTIKSISDKLGSCYKRCLLKLNGEFNFQDLKHIHVLFNDKNAQVLSANRDVIILETSPLPKGIYQIMISFDQKTYIVGPKFTVYDPAIPEDLTALQTLFFEPSPLRVEETGQETISSFK